MEFTTKIDVDAYGVGRHDMRVSEGKLIWALDFEMKNEGVKSIYITPKWLYFQMEWTENYLHDIDKDDWEERELYEEFEIDLTKGDWKVKEDIEIDRSIWPSGVNIDFDRKEIEVS